MRGTQYLAYLNMKYAPTNEQNIEMTHLTISEHLKEVRKGYWKKQPKPKAEQLDINGDNK